MGERNLVQMSIVKIVEAELKTLVREDMRAAIMTASIRPRSPGETAGTRMSRGWHEFGTRMARGWAKLGDSLNKESAWEATCGHQVQNQEDEGNVGTASSRGRVRAI